MSNGNDQRYVLIGVCHIMGQKLLLIEFDENNLRSISIRNKLRKEESENIQMVALGTGEQFDAEPDFAVLARKIATMKKVFTNLQAWSNR